MSKFRPDPSKRAVHLAAPMLAGDTIGDSVDGIQSMVDGRYYDSKDALRSHYKERGVVEVGNEKQKYEPPAPRDRTESKECIAKIMSNYGI